jgi:hypothetical protein
MRRDRYIRVRLLIEWVATPAVWRIMQTQDLIRQKEMIDARLSEAMAAIRAGADSFPGLTRLIRTQRQLNELLEEAHA